MQISGKLHSLSLCYVNTSQHFQGAKSHSSVRESKQKFTTPLSPSNTFWQQLQLWQFWMARWYLWPFLFCQFRWRWWQHSWWFVVREGKWIVVISSDSTWCPLAGHTLAQYQVVATDSVIQECECPWIRGQRMTIIEREGTVGRYVRGRQKWYLRKQSSQDKHYEDHDRHHEDRLWGDIWESKVHKLGRQAARTRTGRCQKYETDSTQRTVHEYLFQMRPLVTLLLHLRDTHGFMQLRKNLKLFWYAGLWLWLWLWKNPGLFFPILFILWILLSPLDFLHPDLTDLNPFVQELVLK